MDNNTLPEKYRYFAETGKIMKVLYVKYDVHETLKELWKEDRNVEEDVDFILMDTDKWWWAKCEHCGWEASSEHCDGGTPIGETGDYTDPMCPKCGCRDLEGDPVLHVESYSGIIAIPIKIN